MEALTESSKEDKLGLDVVYIQANRWGTNSVGRPDVMQFVGALQPQHANKGIFITTSRFTDDARAYVAQIGSKIVLIDGAQLTDLMIDHGVGVSAVSLYPAKEIDSDYFSESDYPERGADAATRRGSRSKLEQGEPA